MKISIIILIKNGREHIKRCLDKVTGQKGGYDLEIIAIDSGSIDGTVDILKAYPLKLHAIPAENFSHSRTRNMGASLATGEYVVYLSQDAEPADENWLDHLVAPLLGDMSVGAVFGKQIPAEENNPVNRFRIQWMYGNDVLVKHKDSEFGFPRKYFSFSNVNAVVRRDLLMRFPFREDILFCEDIYLAKELLSNGYKIVYDPAAVVFHSHNHSMAGIFSRYFDIAIAYRKIGILDKAGDIENEGKRYVLEELKYLTGNDCWIWVPYALANNLAKYLGFQMGCAEHVLPLVLKNRISKYWYKNAEGELDGLTMLSLKGSPLFGWRGVVKHILDIAASLAGLILMSSIMLIIAICIKLTSKGPIFYSQERVGMNGKRFMLYKFRTMKIDAEAQSGAVFAKKDDVRATNVGRILRKFSLDELPQLVNVLKGDLSIVGPRPERPEFVAEFYNNIPGYLLRHKIRMGMTGWAQVNKLRGNSCIKTRLQYDLYYIEHWSFWFDLKILFLTFYAVIRGEGY